MVPDLINNTECTTAADLVKEPHSAKMSLEEVLPILISPDTGNKLEINDGGNLLTDKGVDYPIKSGSPVLYPKAISSAFLSNGLSLDYYNDPELQYYLLSQIKQHGEVNAPSESTAYQRHLFRMKDFLQGFNGLVLDIGCDDINIGAALLSADSKYLGLDPFSTNTQQFKIIGVGEALPFSDNVFDVAIFNTSLDHILDYHTAINEAYRVLKPGGVLVICTLVWINNASLIRDIVHFHHFREFEIIGAMSQTGKIVKEKRYPYKDDKHRYGLFVASQKLVGPEVYKR